jgi:cytochrome c-type biogenesis protein
MLSPNVVLAATAGVASFLSPCMLPVVPAFLARLGDVALSDRPDRRRLFSHALCFVLGFSLVFATLGVVFESVLASATTEIQTWLARGGGLFVVVFGLQMTGLIEIRALNRGRALPGTDRTGLGVSLALGGVFAVTWTPCVGPVLGSTFALAASQPTEAFPILVAYSLGLGLPFLGLSLVPGRASGLLTDRGRIAKRLRQTLGAVVIVLGVLVFTQRLELLGVATYALQG